MAAKICAKCGKRITMLSLGTVTLRDGYVCQHCLNEAGMNAFKNSAGYDSKSTLELIKSREPLVRSYVPSREVKDVSVLMGIDETNKLLFMAKNIIPYKDVITYELLEDENTVTKGGLGTAVAGGLAFGAAGAVVGSVVGKKTQNICSSMQLRVTLRNSFTDSVNIKFIIEDTKKSSYLYKHSQEKAQECISLLEIVLDYNRNNAPVDTVKAIESESMNAQALSAADEILKFKQLLDAGILTQDEFDAKKKQLLNL